MERGIPGNSSVPCGLALDWFTGHSNWYLFMFIGATGKSAQLILHTWLADAMEGEHKSE